MTSRAIAPRLRAMAMASPDLMATLREELRLSATVDARTLAKRGASEERPLVVVIDGLNEHGDREPLLASILAVAKEVREARHLKLVVSWRSEHAGWADAAKAQAVESHDCTASHVE